MKTSLLFPLGSLHTPRPVFIISSEPRLSFREHQTLQQIANGLTSREIADIMYLSADTIESHRKNIIKKLSVKNTAEAVAYGFRYRLIK